MLCIGTIFLFVKFDFFIIRKFGNFVKQNSYRIKKKYLVCATLFFPPNPKFKIKKTTQNVPKFKYFECCITKNSYRKTELYTPPPPPFPFPNPTPTPNVFVKIVFLQPISEKLLESPYTFLLFCF